MSFLLANLPPVHCFVRKEFLYDFKEGHGEYVPCIWVSIKSIRGQAFRIESYLPEYGALYDKLPLSAYVSRDHNLEPEEICSFRLSTNLGLSWLQHGSYTKSFS